MTALAAQARSYNILRDQFDKLEKEIKLIENDKMTVEEQYSRTIANAGHSTETLTASINLVKEELSRQTLSNAEKATEI